MLTDRRRILAVLAGSFAAPPFFVPPAFAQAPAMTRVSAYAFSFAGLEGPDIRLADHAGKPILVVNTASLCGYTPPICRPAAALDALSRARAHDRGRPLERFRRPGAGRDSRHHADRAWRLRHRLSSRRQGAGEGPEPASVLSTSGRPPSAPWKRRAGTFTNTSSAATATSPRFLPPRSSRWTPASSTRS